MSNLTQVTQTEITEWENKFRTEVSSLVKFDVDENNQSSFKLYNGDSGIEVSWSGIIQLGSDNYIKWNFSVQHGMYIETKATLTEDNYQIIPNMFNFYKGWKEQWSKNMTLPDQSPTPSAQKEPAPALQENFIKRNKTKNISRANFINENK